MWSDRLDMLGIDLFGFEDTVPAPGDSSPPDASMFVYGQPFGPAARTINPGARHSSDASGACSIETTIVNNGVSVLRVARSAVRMQLLEDFTEIPANGGSWKFTGEHSRWVIFTTGANSKWNVVAELNRTPNLPVIAADGKRSGGHPGFDPELSGMMRPTPGSTVDVLLPIPFNGRLSLLEVWADDVPTTGGAYTVEVLGNDQFGEADNALLAAPFDMTGLSADTVTSLGALTSVAAHLTMKGTTGGDTEVMTVRMVSDNVDLASGDFLFFATYLPT